MDTQRYTVWAKHEKSRKWLVCYRGLTGQQAAEDMAIRQDRVRRDGYNTQFKVTRDEELP